MSDIKGLDKPLTLLLKPGTKAIHNDKEFDTLPMGELITVFRENETHYFGNYSEPFGMLMVNMEFNKKDCEEVTPAEAKEIFLRTHSLPVYEAWFGEDAV